MPVLDVLNLEPVAGLSILSFYEISLLCGCTRLTWRVKIGITVIQHLLSSYEFIQAETHPITVIKLLGGYL